MISELLNLALPRAAWVLGFILAVFLPCPAQDTPKFEGTGIPVPPGQSQAWSAPQNDLPPDALSAMTDLFKVGLADPRGCEYRQVEVVVGSCWGYSNVMKTDGWVLPSADKQKFGICWNGLVYPLVSVGPAADLHSDISAMLTKDRAQIVEARSRFDQTEKQREDEAKREGKEYHHIDWPLRWNTNVVPEATSIATDSMRPIKAALLLRVGETELAEKVWSEWSSVMQQMGAYNPHLQLADDWVWALFDRAVCAHMRGDDHLALASAQALLPIQQGGMASTAKANPTNSGTPNNSQSSSPDLAYLDSLPLLIADEERRIEEPAYTPVLQMANPPQGRERIAGLIRDLELVSARQEGQPGGINLAEDPIVQALIQAGDDAVEPLINCLETDTRLTRSVRFGRDFFPSRTILGVHEAAYAALAGILQTDFFSSGSTADSLTAHGLEGRKEVAAEIRAYWQKYKGHTLQDRWYQTLSDDKAAPAQWLEAAENIVQDSDVEVERSSMFGAWTSFSPRQPGVIPPMCGEPLRTKTNPSVSDLLLHRMQDLSVSMNQVYDSNLRAKTQLALILAKWDGRAHYDALRKMTETLKKRIGYPNEGLESEISPIVSVYKARVATGDPVALPEYASWLLTVPRDNLDSATSVIFDIMWQHPNDPAMRQAAEKLFVGRDSPWVPLLIKKNSFALGLMNSPLVGMAAFRAELLRGLTDKSSAGSIALGDNSYINVNGDGGWGTSGGSCFLDSSAPAAGTIMPFRACDLYAFEISQLEGAPKYQLYWPLEKRDGTIPILAQFLQRYGNLYQYQPRDSDEHDIFNKARIHFPKLDHPATQDDVDQNRAIFSLSGESRLWHMPTFPMKASWTTLKDDPEQGVQFDGKKVVVYNTEGRVFQAEETLVNGKWERFFGFVGLHRIAKVPASEIEFTSYQRPLVPHFEGILSGPPAVAHSGSMFPTFPSIKVGDPMPITFKVRNINGADQKLPAVLTPPTTDGKTFPSDLTVVLLHTDTLLQAETLFRGAVNSIKWDSVPLKSQTASAAMPSPSPILGPEEEYTVSNLNLRDLFDLSRVGTYRLYVTTDPKETPQLSESLIFTEKAEN